MVAIPLAAFWSAARKRSYLLRGGRRPRRDDEREADPLVADGLRRGAAGDVRDNGVGVGLVAGHQEAAEGEVAGRRQGAVGDCREGERPGRVGVDLVAAVDLGHRGGREHVPGPALDEGRATGGGGDPGCGVGGAAVQSGPQVGQLGRRRLGREGARALVSAGVDGLPAGVPDAAADHHPVAGRLGQEVGRLAGQEVGLGVPDQLGDGRLEAVRAGEEEVGGGDRGEVDRAAEGDGDPGPEVEPVLPVQEAEVIADRVVGAVAGRHREVHPEAGQLGGIVNGEGVARHDAGVGTVPGQDLDPGRRAGRQGSQRADDGGGQQQGTELQQQVAASWS